MFSAVLSLRLPTSFCLVLPVPVRHVKYEDEVCGPLASSPSLGDWTSVPRASEYATFTSATMLIDRLNRCLTRFFIVGILGIDFPTLIAFSRGLSFFSTSLLRTGCML